MRKFIINDGDLFDNGITCLKVNTGKKATCGSYVGLFLCHCGKEFEGIAYRVKNHRKSCGCLVGKASKHGFTQHERYASYRTMLSRCFNEKNRGYKNYGGRGITVCDRWLGEEGFMNFLSDMGEKPVGMSLDRIDNDGDYTPSNCRWATPLDQCKNRRNSNLYKFKDCEMTLGRICSLTGASKNRVDENYKSDMNSHEFIEKLLKLRGTRKNASGWVGISVDNVRNCYKVCYKVSGKKLSKRFKSIDDALKFQREVLLVDNRKVPV